MPLRGNQRRLELENKIANEDIGSSEERKNRQLQNLGKRNHNFTIETNKIGIRRFPYRQSHW